MAEPESAYLPRQLPTAEDLNQLAALSSPNCRHDLPSDHHRLPYLRPSVAVAGIPRRAVYRRQADRRACGW
jgi:hypothetical protein